MDLKKIAELDWEKRWNEPSSLLEDSYLGDHYIHALKRDFGIGFTHIFFLYRDGMTVCYRLTSDTEKVGKHLAEMLQAASDGAAAWFQILKEKTDELIKLTKKPADWFLNISNYSLFEAKLFDYLPVFCRINIVPDYLPEKGLQKSMADLEKARLYSEPAYHEVEKVFEKMFAVMANKENRKTQWLRSLIQDELHTYFQKSELPSERDMEERYHLSGLYIHETGARILSGKEAEELEKLIAAKHTRNPSERRGVPASPGRATGRVRIVLDPKETGRFEEGDILVTSMTNPDFLPLMKKAGAILTEAGGLLSHAAITSRELGKPCILNVHGATKALQDGDMVKVDANAGVIKVIKKWKVN